MPTKAEQRERTRDEILRIATRRFAESGFAGVALEDLVAEAGLTRGALYHHFGSKLGLFAAVVERAQFAVADAVEQAAGVDAPPLDAFLAGCRAFLEASLAPEVRRILLVDGPAVLGWGDWRDGDLESSARLLDAGVAELAEAGVIRSPSLGTVTTMISGALNEVAIANATAADPQRGIDDAVATLARMISGLAADADSGIAQPPGP
jgi:AcrR family transcriptional regulator